MITTRYGVDVKPLSTIRDARGNITHVVCDRLPDHATREYPLFDLRADDGIAEILKAVAELPSVQS